MVESSSQCDLSFYANLGLLAQSGRDLVCHPEPQSPDESDLPEQGEPDDHTALQNLMSAYNQNAAPFNWRKREGKCAQIRLNFQK